MTRMPHKAITSIQVCVLSALLIAALSGWVAASGPATLEYRVKAAFLINFAKFVSWPERAFPGPTAPLVFLIAGDDPFGDAFDAFRGKTVANRPVVVRQLRSLDDIAACHILFIPRATDRDSRYSALLQRAGQVPVLIITDGDDRASDGVMITMFLENNKVAFSINNGLAKRSGLLISAKLLTLAAHVVN